MKSRRLKRIPTLLLLSCLPSCAMFGPDTPATMSGALPTHYAASDKDIHNNKSTEYQWWKEFKSEELDRLIDDAFKQNLDIKQTYARLVQAGATATQSGADIFPTVEGSGKRGSTRTHTEAQGTSDANAFELGVLVSYELDLWGRVRSSVKEAEYTYDASAEDLNAAYMTLASEVASRWLNIVTYKIRVQQTIEEIATAQQALDLVELRFKKGQVMAPVVLQQKQTLAQTESQLPKLEAQLAAYQNQLALLLGKVPGKDLIEIKTTQFPEVKEVPQAGVPAQLLESRPDIRKAMNKLQAAEWNVSKAKSNLLPKISLSAGYTYSAQNYAALFNNWIGTLAANLTAPIFEGGARAAEVTKTKAAADEMLASYKETVLTAVQEVEDALTNEKKQQDYIKKIEAKHGAASANYQNALLRFQKGVDTYLSALNAKITQKSLDDDLIAAQQDALLYRITLYKALGRGWQKQYGNK